MSYNIDKDITLYSFAELQTMARIWANPNANHSSIPFSEEVIWQEIRKREHATISEFTK